MIMKTAQLNLSSNIFYRKKEAEGRVQCGKEAFYKCALVRIGRRSSDNDDADDDDDDDDDKDNDNDNDNDDDDDGVVIEEDDGENNLKPASDIFLATSLACCFPSSVNCSSRRPLRMPLALSVS